ncbi:hypothetical protein B0H16DRAFT_1751764 [Mycena metata]|uniref:Uncharacterized protein n=1 Tax=Mycena metata TaxID=1033252 RepID=A0AAD7DM62_9AGAR|nr:hypothetical protein B0H16DRAFT_1751764 [Mycena metata]
MLNALGETRSLISGSVLVAALFPGRFKPNDVDIYCPETTGTRLLDIMQNRFGFHLNKGVDVQYPRHLAIRKIHWLTKGSAKINLMLVEGDNAAVAVFQFHSTIVMNVLSVHGLYCTYGDLTLAGEGLVNNSQTVDEAQAQRNLRCIEKYEGRGFKFERRLGNYKRYADHECGINASCPTTVRTLHDGHSTFFPLTAHLETDKESNTKNNRTAFDGKHSVVWSLGGDSCGWGHDGFAFSVELHDKKEEETAWDEGSR